MTRYLGNLTTNNIVIASGQTVSAALDLQGLALTAIQIPAAFTGASITFQGSFDNSTFQAIYNTSNTAYSITVGTSRTYAINPADFAGFRYIKIVSASAEGAERTIVVSSREAA